MAIKNKQRGFRKLFHFMSCWGFGEAVVMTLAAVTSFAWPARDKSGDWIGLCVGLSMIFVYLLIAELSRPRDDEGEEP
jgi:hypothetical protein